MSVSYNLSVFAALYSFPHLLVYMHRLQIRMSSMKRNIMTPLILHAPRLARVFEKALRTDGRIDPLIEMHRRIKNRRS